MLNAPKLATAQMNLVRPKAPVIGTVVSNDLCMNGKSASFVRHTVIDVSNTPLAGSFKAGQSFGVVPPGVDDAGKPHKVRLYSIACPSWGEDGQGLLLSTTPKRLIDEYNHQYAQEASEHSLFLGVCSNYLCDLGPGDPVQLTGPQGKRFLLPEQPAEHDYLFLATGTGIAPFRGMILELLTGPQGPTTRQIDLVMGTPYRTDLLYDSLFTELAEAHANFRYHTAISREADRLYVASLLERQLDHFGPLLKQSSTLIYVCGLAGMEQGLFDLLFAQGLDSGYCARVGERCKPTPRCMLEVY